MSSPSKSLYHSDFPDLQFFPIGIIFVPETLCFGVTLGSYGELILTLGSRTTSDSTQTIYGAED